MAISNPTTVKTTVKAIASANIFLDAIQILIFVYDDNLLSAVVPPAKYTWGSFADTAGKNGNLIAAGHANIIRSYNTIIGMTSF